MSCNISIANAAHSKIDDNIHLVAIMWLTSSDTIYTNSMCHNLNKARHLEAILNQLAHLSFGNINIFHDKD